jgi:small-conductance mechanosensitive channel
MKRNLLPLAFVACVILATALPAPAQESPAAAAAEREERDANFRRMSALIEQLQETLQSQQRRMNTLVEEIHNLREQVDKLKNKAESTATLDAIKQLATKIEEVDTKRQKDNELVYKKISALGKEVATTLTPRDPIAAPPPKVIEKPTAKPDVTAPPENVMEYKIKDGDTLSRILRDLSAINVKVTEKQIRDANPKVNWNRLIPGKTIIYIPVTQ